MTGLAFLGLAVAGGLGAVLRFVVDGSFKARTQGALPVGTIFINVTGSFLIGIVVGLASATVLDDVWATILASGLLGGYTTFSTASFETARLVQQQRPLIAVVNSLGPIFVGLVAAVVGLVLGGLA